MITDLKELKQLVSLCRKAGIDAIEVGDIKISFGRAPMTLVKSKKAKEANTLVEDYNIDMPDILTPEQLMFYSAQTTATTDTPEAKI